MLKDDITFGQFLPGKSILHKTDPRFKILLLIVFLVTVLLARSPIAYAFITLLTASLLIASRLPLKVLFKGLKPLTFVLIFTALMNIFLSSGETLLVHWGFIRIYKEGLISALFMMLRLICLFLGSSVILTYTTSPLALTDGLERLLMPLAKIKVPVHDFAMMMTVALRFIPTLIEETDKIMSAQKARGSDFETGGLMKRLKALIPILIPLFYSAIRRAYDLAEAMECRCYNGGKGKTRMKISKAKFSDFAVLTFMICCAVGTSLLNKVFPL